MARCNDFAMSFMPKSAAKRKPKLSPVAYAARFAAEKALQQRRYCNPKSAAKRKPKLSPVAYAARFAAEKALQQRRYCNAFALWRTCQRRWCRRNQSCGGDQNACLQRALDRVPHDVQWRARQDILSATPANIGGPERAARQCMPRNFYE